MSSAGAVRLAIVEDEGLFRDLLRRTLDSHPGLEVVGDFGDLDVALAMIPGLEPDVALLDIHLGGGRTEIDLGLALQAKLPSLGIVLLSQQADAGHLAALPDHAVRSWSYLV